MKLFVGLLTFALMCFGVAITTHTLIHLGPETETTFLSILSIIFRSLGGLLIAITGIHFFLEDFE